MHAGLVHVAGGSQREPVGVVDSPRAVEVNDIADGLVFTFKNRRKDLVFHCKIGIELHQSIVVEARSPVVDVAVPSALAAIGEIVTLGNGDKGIETRRMHPVAPEIERLTGCDVLGQSPSANPVGGLQQRERQALFHGHTGS